MANLQKVKALGNLVASGDLLQAVKTIAGAQSNQPDALCPCCAYTGRFRLFGDPIRYGAMCPQCFSLERQRLLALATQRGAIVFTGKRILHFAPELATQKMVRAEQPATYQGSSYPATKEIELSLNIEAMDHPSNSFDTVICSHVLEHVDDGKALAEIFRVLDSGGQLVAMIPIVEGWSTTYEDASKISESDRRLHFGQFDHVRYYGADFRDRVRNAGFVLDEFSVGGAETIKYSLMRGERIFIATKP